MSKIKYRYNTKSLTYEKLEVNWKNRIWRIVSYLATGTFFTAITVFIAYNYFDSPKQKMQKREIEQLKLQYELLSGRLTQINTVLNDLEQRDDNIYRVVFEADPIPSNIRKSGIGGTDRYKSLQEFKSSDLIIETTKKLDNIAKRMYVQSKSFDEVILLAKNKEQMLSSIPAIQPISNNDLRHVPSGYGWRTHPIYKTSEFHPGMDFSSPEGTEIYATGDGVIERADNLATGYGNHVVIEHGYGYQTLYGHMSKMKVVSGQKIKRGQIIGYVGNTGLSTAPHVHYEVIKNGQKVNPVNFYYNDLTPEQYKQLIEQSSKASQTFD